MSDFLDIHAMCIRLGGTRPVSPSTVYRRVREGVLPRPVKIAPHAEPRWVKSDVDAAIMQALTDAKAAQVPSIPVSEAA